MRSGKGRETCWVYRQQISIAHCNWVITRVWRWVIDIVEWWSQVMWRTGIKEPRFISKRCRSRNRNWRRWIGSSRTHLGRRGKIQIKSSIEIKSIVTLTETQLENDSASRRSGLSIRRTIVEMRSSTTRARETLRRWRLSWTEMSLSKICSNRCGFIRINMMFKSRFMDKK